MPYLLSQEEGVLAEGFLAPPRAGAAFHARYSFKDDMFFSPWAGPKSPGKGVSTRGEFGFLKPRTEGEALAPPGGMVDEILSSLTHMLLVTF